MAAKTKDTIVMMDRTPGCDFIEKAPAGNRIRFEGRVRAVIAWRVTFDLVTPCIWDDETGVLVDLGIDGYEYA